MDTLTAWDMQIRADTAAFEADMQRQQRLMGSYGDPLLDAITIHGFWLVPRRTWWGRIKWQLEGRDENGEVVVVR